MGFEKHENGKCKSKASTKIDMDLFDILGKFFELTCSTSDISLDPFDMSNVSISDREVSYRGQEIEAAKRREARSIRKLAPNSHMKERLVVINDYVFRCYYDLFKLQLEFRNRHGRYFQGKKTTVIIPNFNRNQRVYYGSGLTDSVKTWKDLGYQDVCAPVQLESHICSGPQGDGYMIFARLRINEDIWQIVMHHGPEKRNIENMSWIMQ